MDYSTLEPFDKTDTHGLKEAFIQRRSALVAQIDAIKKESDVLKRQEGVKIALDNIKSLSEALSKIDNTIEGVWILQHLKNALPPLEKELKELL